MFEFAAFRHALARPDFIGAQADQFVVVHDPNIPVTLAIRPFFFFGAAGFAAEEARSFAVLVPVLALAVLAEEVRALAAARVVPVFTFVVRAVVFRLAVPCAFEVARVVEDFAVVAFLAVAFFRVAAVVRRAVVFVLVALDFALTLGFEPTRAGLPLRLVEASSSSCCSVMDEAMLFEAPLSLDFGVLPRFAERAAPAAFCWAADLAGMFW